MARKYAGYKRLSIKVKPGQMQGRYVVHLLSGNGRHLMRGMELRDHDKATANGIARRLGDSFRPACTVRTTLVE